MSNWIPSHMRRPANRVPPPLTEPQPPAVHLQSKSRRGRLSTSLKIPIPLGGHLWATVVSGSIGTSFEAQKRLLFGIGSTFWNSELKIQISREHRENALARSLAQLYLELLCSTPRNSTDHSLNIFETQSSRYIQRISTSKEHLSRQNKSTNNLKPNVINSNIDTVQWNSHWLQIWTESEINNCFGVTARRGSISVWRGSRRHFQMQRLLRNQKQERHIET